MHSDKSLDLNRILNIRVLLLFAIVVVAMHGAIQVFEVGPVDVVMVVVVGV